MKAIMYHYIHNELSPYFYKNYLHIDDFRKQLDYFDQTEGFVTKEDFVDIINGKRKLPDKGVVLTFDDGLKDHFNFVLPELISRGLWGIFYIPTDILRYKKLLDVHRIHHLLGTTGGIEILQNLLLGISYKKSFKATTHNSSEIYKYQDNDHFVRNIKTMLNYHLTQTDKEIILSEAMNKLDTN